MRGIPAMLLCGVKIARSWEGGGWEGTGWVEPRTDPAIKFEDGGGWVVFSRSRMLQVEKKKMSISEWVAMEWKGSCVSSAMKRWAVRDGSSMIRVVIDLSMNGAAK